MRRIMRRVDDWLATRSALTRAIIACCLFLASSALLTLVARLVLGEPGSSLIARLTA